MENYNKSSWRWYSKVEKEKSNSKKARKLPDLTTLSILFGRILGSTMYTIKLRLCNNNTKLKCSKLVVEEAYNFK